MKKRKAQQTILLLLFSCICFCSCEKEKGPEKVELSYIQLSMPQSIHVETKSGKGTPNLGGITVNDVWIVQFEIKQNGSTGTCLKALHVPQSNISQSTEPATDLIVNLQTGGSLDNEIAKFLEKNSRFYVIANGGKSLFTTNTTDNANMYLLTGDELTSLTEEILKAKTINIGTGENPLVTTPPTLLSSEPFDYTPTEEGIIKIRTQMFRAFAKIKINIKSLTPGLFTLDQGGTQKGVKIYNLPQKMATYRAGGGKNQAYPLINDINSSAFDLYVDQITADKRDVSSEFYMAENLRGIGTSTTQQGKNQNDNGPGTDIDKLAGCTKIELSGTYKYDPAHVDGLKVKYTFYMGGNFTNDYNIARDYSYELTFRIAGPNSADVRVDITDGNVAVFDEVVIIPDITVDF